MHDRLFARQRDLADGDLARYAADLGLDAAAFARDMGEHAHLARIEEDVESGLRSGVEGTPTLFVNGRRHEGGYDREALLAVLGGEG
jgi:2-hydroxychromene-2-carboxylate isomerase